MAATKSLKKCELEAKWYLIDATDCTLGRLAAYTANILRGKHKPTWTPNMDCGDHVIIINADKVVLTGKKLDQKMYYHHTGYIGNMKKVKYSTLLNEKPEFVMTKAIKGMIPDNTLGRNALTRLRVYAGAEHAHAAQKPEVVEF